MYGTFTNYNFRLKRHFKYQEEGRYQTESEADKVDADLIQLIEDNGVQMITINSTDGSPEKQIFHTIFEKPQPKPQIEFEHDIIY